MSRVGSGGLVAMCLPPVVVLAPFTSERFVKSREGRRVDGHQARRLFLSFELVGFWRRACRGPRGLGLDRLGSWCVAVAISWDQYMAVISIMYVVATSWDWYMAIISIMYFSRARLCV